jgi:hypothetical protein
MNLKTETLELLKDNNKTLDDIKEYYINYTEHRDENGKFYYNYKHTEFYGDGNSFDISKLDFEYDDSYGTQEVHGFISFTDDTWLEREEYDGSEWWDFKECPKIEWYTKE